MTPNMILLSTAAIATIGMLALFARHNRKTGWRKERPSLEKALNLFYADSGMEAEEKAPVAPQTNPAAALSFSAQLVQLRNALGTTAPVKTRELVHQ